MRRKMPGFAEGAVTIFMSALPPKADMCGATMDVRFGPIADSCGAAKGSFFDQCVDSQLTIRSAESARQKPSSTGLGGRDIAGGNLVLVGGEGCQDFGLLALRHLGKV
jgi:hypothetical protein